LYYDIEVTDEVTWSHTPMEYFARIGDLPMCRFLLSEGAATTSEYEYWFPMLAAARGGHLNVCKWLCQFDAREDMHAINSFGHTPLVWVCRRDSILKQSAPHRNASGYFEIGKWLILEGALSNQSGHVARLRLRRDFAPRSNMNAKDYDPRPAYLNWADGVLADHQGFVTFLNGVCTRSLFYSESALQSLFSERLGNASAASITIECLPEDKRLRVWKELIISPLQSLAGNTGVLKSIADYAGVARGRDLRIIRGLAKELRLFIEEVPGLPQFLDDEIDDSENDDDGDY